MVGDEVGEALGVGHAAGEEDGVDVAFEGDGHFADGFCGGVAHGAEDEHGVEVAVVDAVENLRHGRGAEVRHEAALAHHLLNHLVVGVFA